MMINKQTLLSNIYKKFFLIFLILFSHHVFAIESFDLQMQRDELIKRQDEIKKSKEYQEFERAAEGKAKELQHVLASKLLESMYQGLDNNSVIGVNNGEKVFRSMLNDEYAHSLDLKLVEPIKKQLINMRFGKELNIHDNNIRRETSSSR